MTKGGNDASHFEQKEEISMFQGLVSSEKDGMFRTKGRDRRENNLESAGSHGPRG